MNQYGEQRGIKRGTTWAKGYMYEEWKLEESWRLCRKRRRWDERRQLDRCSVDDPTSVQVGV